MCELELHNQGTQRGGGEGGRWNGRDFVQEQLIHQGFPSGSYGKENWVRSLAWEDPLKEGIAIHSSILAWRVSMERGSWRATVHEVAKNWA